MSEPTFSDKDAKPLPKRKPRKRTAPAPKPVPGTEPKYGDGDAVIIQYGRLKGRWATVLTTAFPHLVLVAHDNHVYAYWPTDLTRAPERKR